MKGSRGFRIVFGVLFAVLFGIYFYVRVSVSPHSDDFDEEHAFVYSEAKKLVESGVDLDEYYKNDPRYADIYAQRAAAMGEASAPAPQVTPEPTAEPQEVQPTEEPVETKSDLPDIDINDWQYMLVNYNHHLDPEYAPPEIAKVSDSNCPQDSRIAQALMDFANGCKEAGLPVYLSSGYRSYADQKANLQRKLDEGYDYDTAITIVAEPGSSEHQTGLCCDITDIYRPLKNDSLENTDTFKWLNEHCAEYGFILRYPKDKGDITGGIIYEPWHFRYVGVEAATYIKEHDLTLEEFWELYVPGTMAGEGNA